MPSHKKHRSCDKVFLGKEYPLVHRYMDEPYKVLGMRHRVLRHDIETCLLLGIMFGENAFRSAVLHIVLDRVWRGDSKKEKRKKRGKSSSRKSRKKLKK